MVLQGNVQSVIYMHTNSGIKIFLQGKFKVYLKCFQTESYLTVLVHLPAVLVLLSLRRRLAHPGVAVLDELPGEEQKKDPLLFFSKSTRSGGSQIDPTSPFKKEK